MTNCNFEHWWTLPGDWIEPPNERGKGWSAVLRAPNDGRPLYVKRQFNYFCRTLRHPLGWPTASRERHYLDRLDQLGIDVPVPVFHGVRKTERGIEAVLVTEELTGYTDLGTLSSLDPARRAEVAHALGTVLGRLHRARLQHSCLYDKHVMVRLDDGQPPRIALIDLEKMRPCLTRRNAARRDLDQLHRRQRIFSPEDWQVLLNAHAQAMRTDSPSRAPAV